MQNFMLRWCILWTRSLRQLIGPRLYPVWTNPIHPVRTSEILIEDANGYNSIFLFNNMCTCVRFHTCNTGLFMHDNPYFPPQCPFHNALFVSYESPTPPQSYKFQFLGGQSTVTPFTINICNILRGGGNVEKSALPYICIRDLIIAMPW